MNEVNIELIPTEGFRVDAGKPRLDLVPPEAVMAMGEILGWGHTVKGYPERNWERGMAYGKCFAATLRHLYKWWSGHSIDEESGRSHLWHAITDLAMLLSYEQRGIGQDDRHKGKAGL